MHIHDACIIITRRMLSIVGERELSLHTESHVHVATALHSELLVLRRMLINPRRACAARVIVVVLSFCLSVCLSVCYHVFCRYEQQDGQ